MKALFLLSFLFSFSTYSQQFEIPFPDEDIDAMIERLQEIGSEYGHNGGAYADTYDVDNFDYSEVADSFVKNKNEVDVVDFKWAEILWGAKFYADTPDFRTIMDRLMDAGYIKAMFGVGPDEDKCTESEYCSYYYMTIYLKNGVVINLDFDWTT